MARVYGSFMNPKSDDEETPVSRYGQVCSFLFHLKVSKVAGSAGGGGWDVSYNKPETPLFQ